jgi:hypothetical protein
MSRQEPASTPHNTSHEIHSSHVANGGDGFEAARSDLQADSHRFWKAEKGIRAFANKEHEPLLEKPRGAGLLNDRALEVRPFRELAFGDSHTHRTYWRGASGCSEPAGIR